MHEDYGSIESFEDASGGVRMNFSKDGVRGSAEAAVVVRIGPRVRAVALRLDGQDGKWRVSALQVG